MKKNSLDREELILKILSIVIAILLWSYVMSEVDPVITRTFMGIPVELEGVSTLKERGYQLVNNEEYTIDVNVVGNRKQINNMRHEDLKASVDVSKLRAGNHSATVNIKLSTPGVRLQEGEIFHISLEVDEIITKTMDIEVYQVGELPDGYMLGTITLSTEEVEVTGPKKLIDKVDKVVARINLNNRTDGTVVNAPIYPIDEEEKEISGLTLSEVSAEAQIPISSTKTVPVEIVYSDEVPEDFLKDRVTISPNIVTIYGDRSIIDKVDHISTEPISPYSLMNNETQQVGLEVPDGLELANTTESFVVRYNQSEIIEDTIEIPIENVVIYPNTAQVNILDSLESIKIKIEGEESLLSQLKPKDITVDINVEELPIGKHTVKLDAKVPTGVEIIKIKPETLKIELK